MSTLRTSITRVLSICLLKANHLNTKRSFLSAYKVTTLLQTVNFGPLMANHLSPGIHLSTLFLTEQKPALTTLMCHISFFPTSTRISFEQETSSSENLTLFLVLNFKLGQTFN